MDVRTNFLLAILIFIIISLSACLEEERVLGVDQLYSDNLIDDFSQFEPCDTVFDGRYALYRIMTGETNTEPEVELFYEFETPEQRIFFFARNFIPQGGIPGQQAEELYFHGMIIYEKTSGRGSYVLVEDNTGLPGFENTYIIGNSSSFPSDFMVVTSTDFLASSAYSLGENYKLNFSEYIRESFSSSYNMISEGRSLDAGGSILTIEFQETVPGINKTRSKEFLNQMTSGTFPFDREAQTARFDLQLNLTNRDLQFARDFLGSEHASLISEAHQETLRHIDKTVNGRYIQSFFCHEDSFEWEVRDINLPVPSPITN